MSELGTWNPTAIKLGNYYEDASMPITSIFFTPLPTESVDPVTGVSSSIIDTVVSYECNVENKLLEFLNINITSSAIELSSNDFIGLFELNISYKDIVKDTIHHITKWEDLPSGKENQVFNYTPLNPTRQTFDIKVKANLASGKIDEFVYSLDVLTNLDKNVRLLQKAIADRS
jgi:hypothetical protein